MPDDRRTAGLSPRALRRVLLLAIVLPLAESALATPTSDPLMAARRRFPVCPGNVYAVVGDPLVAGGAFVDVDLIAVEAGSITIASGCTPTTVKLKGRKRGTRVRAVWGQCTGLQGRVRLKGRIDPLCLTLTGVLRAKRFKRPFIATVMQQEPAAVCGDGTIDGFELCDDGNTNACDGCAADCSRRDAVCGDGIVECGEECDGFSSCGDGRVCDDGCHCRDALVCAEASVCGARVSCGEASECLCIRTTEGDIRCGAPPSCDIKRCQSTADCAELGPEYFCDTPNSGCCSDGELSRCIRGCEASCPAERQCGSACCALNEECRSGRCEAHCPAVQLCGATCCAEDARCVAGRCETCAAPRTCGATCCPAGQVCRDGGCIDTCAGDEMTPEAIAAAHAALDAGATDVALSPSGCLRYRVTRDNGVVVHEELTSAGIITTQLDHTVAQTDGVIDGDLDGFNERVILQTYGAQPDPSDDVSVFSDYDPATRDLVRRETRTGISGGVHVVIEEAQGGTLVKTAEFDSPFGEGMSWLGTAAAADPPCDPMQDAQDLLPMALSSGEKCLRDLGASTKADTIKKFAARKTNFEFDPDASLIAENLTAEASEAERANTGNRIRIRTGSWCGKTAQQRKQLLFHEALHDYALHDADLVGRALDGTLLRFDEFDQTEACAAMCFGSLKNKCMCAACLGTNVCDPRCKDYPNCQPCWGGICPCDDKYYPQLSVCKAECQGSILCFGRQCRALPNLQCPGFSCTGAE